MAETHRHGPEYLGLAFRADDQEARSFTGPQAFTDAGDWYEAQKADPTVVGLVLARWDGRGWQLVTPSIRRNPAGDWEPEPPAGP